MAPPSKFTETFRWAEHTLAYLQEQGKAGVLLDPDLTLTTSSWFSGYSSPEWAMLFLEKARSKLMSTNHPLFQAAYQFERNAKARQASLQVLPTHTCQHIDIARLLAPSDLKVLEQIEKEGGEQVAERTWEALKGMKLLDAQHSCGRHLQQCPFQTTSLDISGSQCINYSTLGKKKDGKVQKENGPANKLLQLWVKFHGTRQTPLLLHENLKNFSSEYLASLAEEFGYKHIAHIPVRGSDVGLDVNPRQRVHPSRYYIQINFFTCLPIWDPELNLFRRTLSGCSVF